MQEVKIQIEHRHARSEYQIATNEFTKTDFRNKFPNNIVFSDSGERFKFVGNILNVVIVKPLN